jgi:hypothetical protein
VLSRPDPGSKALVLTMSGFIRRERLGSRAEDAVTRPVIVL